MPRIPRRIIQTAKSRDLPPLARAAATNLKLLHPDWDYEFFDDADVARFVADEFPEHAGTFERFPHRIQRFDFFRYLAVLRRGGFYFDLDVFLSEPLDDLLDDGCVFPCEELTLNRFLQRECGMVWELGNYGFGAAPGHPFLEAVVQNCVRALTDTAWATKLARGVPAPFRADFEVLHTTGPGAVTRTYAEAPDLAVQVSVLRPGDMMDERNWHRFGRFGIHLMEASWRQRRNRFARWLALRWENARRQQMRSTLHSAAARESHLTARRT